MKISNIEQKPQIIQQKPHAQNFKGFDSVVVATMDTIEKGGLAASFIAQDVLGNTLPRPIAGLFRNSKENQGKKNTAMAIKEFTREITTGPSMFLIPMAILGGIKKAGSKALNIPANFIKGLGGTFKQTLSGLESLPADNIIKSNYIKDVFSNVLSNSTGKPAEQVKGMAEDLANEFINLPAGKGSKKAYKTALSKLTNKFINIAKKNADNPSADFLSVSLKNQDGKTISTSINNFLGYVSDYADDAIKSTKKANLNNANFKEAAGQFAQKFSDKRILQRFGLNIALMVAITAFLSIVPKIYNATSKGKNPALAGLGVDDNKTTTSKTSNFTAVTVAIVDNQQVKEVFKAIAGTKSLDSQKAGA